MTTWRLLALALDPDRTSPELYALVLESADGEEPVALPLMVDDRIAMFSDPGRAAAVLRQYGADGEVDEVDLEKPYFWCDVAQALYVLSMGGVDEDGAVHDAVNALLLLVDATGINVIAERRRALHDIANYVTMHKDVTRYLEEDGDHSSRELIDAVLWCVGAVAMKTRIV